jgi:hypothetical protein
MSLLSFNNELVFGTGSVTDGVSGIAGDGTSKILYNAADFGITDTTVVTTSATLNGTEYELNLFAGYNGSVFAIIDSNRLSTQFTFASGDSTQTEAASGFISVSPTLRRLHALGYV